MSKIKSRVQPSSLLDHHAYMLGSEKRYKIVLKYYQNLQKNPEKMKSRQLKLIHSIQYSSSISVFLQYGYNMYEDYLKTQEEAESVLLVGSRGTLSSGSLSSSGLTMGSSNSSLTSVSVLLHILNIITSFHCVFSRISF